MYSDNVLPFPARPLPPRLARLADNLYTLKLEDTPEAHAAADKLVIELRKNNYIIPEHLKGE